MGTRGWVAALAVAWWLGAGTAAAQDPVLTHQGRLLDATGGAVVGTATVQFQLYDAATDGTLLWSESQDLTLSSGYYSAILGEENPLTPAVYSAAGLWLQQVVDGQAMGARQRLGAVPRALGAAQVTGGVQIDGGGAAGLRRLDPRHAVGHAGRQQQLGRRLPLLARGGRALRVGQPVGALRGHGWHGHRPR